MMEHGKLLFDALGMTASGSVCALLIKLFISVLHIKVLAKPLYTNETKTELLWTVSVIFNTCKVVDFSAVLQ